MARIPRTLAVRISRVKRSRRGVPDGPNEVPARNEVRTRCQPNGYGTSPALRHLPTTGWHLLGSVPLVRANAASIGASSRKTHALLANAGASRAKARAMRGNAGALQIKVHAIFATVHATPGNLRATRAKSGAIRGNVGAKGVNVPGARGTLRLCSVSLPSIPRGLPREGASVRSVASNVPRIPAVVHWNGTSSGRKRANGGGESFGALEVIVFVVWHGCVRPERGPNEVPADRLRHLPGGTREDRGSLTRAGLPDDFRGTPVPAYLLAASRSRSTSRTGGCPNSRLYSRLNCEASS
jgi:hypothetical protein